MAKAKDAPAAEPLPETGEVTFTPAAPPPASLDDLQSRIEGGSPEGTAQAAETFARAAQPAPEVEAPRKTGRPKGSKTRSDAPSRSGAVNVGASKPSTSMPSGGASGKRSKAELESDNAALRARLDTLEGRAVPGMPTAEEIKQSGQACDAILAIFSLVMVKTKTPELAYTEGERKEIVAVAAKPAAPFLAAGGKYAEWFVVAAVIVSVTAPKVETLLNRIEYEKAERLAGRGDLLEKKRIEQQAPPRQTTETVQTGGLDR